MAWVAPGGVVGRQVGGNDAPGLPAVHRLEQVVACEIDGVWVFGRQDQRTAPVEAELRRQFGAFCIPIGKPVFSRINGIADGRIWEVRVCPVAKIRYGFRGGGDKAVFPSFCVEAHGKPHVVDEVQGAVVGRVGLGMEAIAFPYPGVVFIEDTPPFAAIARAGPEAIVLQAACYPVGFAHIGADSVVLPYRHVVKRKDGLATVNGQAQALVGGEVHDPAVVRGNPQVVVIAAIGVPVALFERLSPIAGNPEIAAYHIDIIWVVGIDLDLSVVVRAQGVLE